MVVASTDYTRALSEPLQAIQDIYEKEGDKVDFTSTVAKHFDAVFSNAEAKAKITPLGRSFLASKLKKAGQLVRWRCMIQDTNLGNELMPKRHRDSRGVYRSDLFGANAISIDDEVIQEVDINPSELSSINTLYGVSLPGQSGWSRIADERLEKIDESSLEVKLSSTHLGECEDESEKHGIPSKLPTGQEFGVLLKVYDEDIAESIRVAQVVDIIGILDECSLPSTEWTTSEEAPSESSDPLHPTIHVISMHKASTPSIDVVKADQQIREALLARLTQVLQGDVLAAEWLLLSLIARLHTRTATHTLGPLSLNISSCSSSQASQLHNLLSDILPLVVNQSLELNHLNDANTHFAPRSKGDELGLSAGSLQVVDGTLLLIDENTMQEGQLKENGIENIRTLSNLLTTRKLTYAFPYSNLEMDADINCVIFSQGKSFLPCDVQVPLQNASRSQILASEPAISSKSKSTSVAEYREYLRDMQSRSSDSTFFRILIDVSDKIQDDFVESRNVKSGAMSTQEDLSRTLQVARLLCISKGGKELSWQDWTDAKELDRLRLARLS